MNRILIKRFTSTSGPIETSSSDCCTKFHDLVHKGNYHQALSLFKQLFHGSSSSFTSYHITPILPSLIKASSHSESSHGGLHLHCLAIKTSAITDLVVSNSLVSLYDKFFDVKSARHMFDEMPQRDSISWNSLINCYIRNGFFPQAIHMFKRMWVNGSLPKPELTASVLSVCSRVGLIRLGREIHGFVVVSGMVEESVFLQTAIVDLYTRCGNLKLVFRVFNQMKVKNEVSWTAMIRGCTANHDHKMALDCLRQMQIDGVKPNRVTLISVMPACAELCSMQHLKGIHGYAFRHGFESEPCFASALMHMYCQYRGSRALQIARTMMERSSERDVVMWSSIIGSHTKNGDIMEAIKHFNQMQLEGIVPNSVTLLTMISAFTNQVSLSYRQTIHSYALKSGLFSDTCVGNSLISMYSKCGCPSESKRVFTEMQARDSITWSALIGAHGISSCGKEALQIFHEMKARSEVDADSITLLSVLTACNYSGLVEEGQELFQETIKENKIPLGIQHYACQVDLLGRSGRIEAACEVVRQMPINPSVRIWSSLLSACIDHGSLDAAEMLAYELINLDPENAANYALLSIVYAKSNDWDSVGALWRFMRVKGLKKSPGFSKVEA